MKDIMDRDSPERKTQAECVCVRVCRGDDNSAPDEKMLHPCDKRELQDLSFAAASQSSRHCVKMPQIKLIKRKALMLVCQPDRWHSTALEVGHPSNSSDDGPLPARPRPPSLRALTAAAVISSSLLGPRLPPLAGSSSLPCTLHRLHEWATELQPLALSVTASVHFPYTRTALNRGTKG